MDVTDLNELLDVQCVKIENNFDGSNDHGESSDPLSVIPSFSDNDLSTEILQTPLTVFSDTVDEDTMQSTDSGDEILVQLMDIRTQLSKLRIILERRVGVDLSDYDFWLQDAKKLEPHKTLVEQCIRGEGVVQVNVQITARSRKINILDVLKPDEEIVQLPTWNEEEPDPPTLDSISPDASYEASETVEAVESDSIGLSPVDSSRHAAAVKWVVDEHFRSELARIRIPDDPADWTALHVKLWIQWAVRQFNLTGIKLSNWNINGHQLYAMTNQEFKERVPNDPGDRFWTHFALLRKCKFIAVVENEEVAPYLKDSSQLQTIKKKKFKPASIHRVITGNSDLPPGQMLKSGQIQLWQFLLDLLTNVDYYHIIRWHGKNGEFKLLKPELVARLWGMRKKKPAMNYEKLSRALRYYYDGDMIAKVPAKRFVYKFVCDLRQLIGYSASELADRVNAQHCQRMMMMTPNT